MKERWSYSDYVDCETEKPVYYRKKQRLTWQFFLRFAKKWFTPCNECQEMLDKAYHKYAWRAMIPKPIGALAIPDMVDCGLRGLCEPCRKKLFRTIKDVDLIFGNKDYEPLVELQRRWVDVEEKNKNGVWEAIIETVTKEEYYKVKGWKFEG